MKSPVLIGAAFLAGCAVSPSGAEGPSSATGPATSLEIVDVTIIDPATRTVSPGVTVRIENGRIAGIGDAAAEDAGFHGRTIDGAGKYLIPGLMDMHVHTNVGPVAETTFNLLLANGVTGVRDMAGDCWEPQTFPFLCIDDLRRYDAEIEAGRLAGPRLWRLSSAFVQSDKTGRLPPEPNPLYTPTTEEEGARLVDYLHERGVDLIKIYHAITPAAYKGVMARAGELGMEVSGHVPLVAGARGAAEAGQRTIEHASEIVVDCSAYSDDYRRRIIAIVGGDSTEEWPGDEERLTGSIETYNPARCRALMALLAERGVYYTPTHGTREMDARAADPAYRANEALIYIPAMQRGQWEADMGRIANEPPAMRRLYTEFYALGLAVTRQAHEAGVALMLGTDANDTMIVPGFAAHDELARLVSAGLEPMEALRAATAVPAQYLGREGDLGRVALGARADLVLLEHNPLEDISHTRTIAGVIAGGRYYDRARLDALLADVAGKVAEMGGGE